MTKVYNVEGIKGYYRGFWVTFIRDVPSWGVYFYSYEVFKKLINRSLSKDNGSTPHQSNLMVMSLSGGLAGIASWLVSYPFDVIKTDI